MYFYLSRSLSPNGYQAKAFDEENITNLKVWVMAITLSAITYFVFPELQLCWWLYGFMFFDFIIAFVREKANGRRFSYAKMRNSISKTIQYTAFLVLLWCLINISGQDGKRMILAMNSAYLFLILVESKSIGESIRDISPESNFSRFVLAPFLHLLEAVIKKKGPVSSDEIKKLDEKQTADK